jgi:hypothetical protein
MNEVWSFQISEILMPLALKIAIAQRAEAKSPYFALKIVNLDG